MTDDRHLERRARPWDDTPCGICGHVDRPDDPCDLCGRPIADGDEPGHCHINTGPVQVAAPVCSEECTAAFVAGGEQYPDDPEVLTARYAERLVTLVREARSDEWARFNPARSWSDLHDVCDANEFNIQVEEEMFGEPCWSLHGADDAERQARTDMVNEAVEQAQEALWTDGKWRGYDLPTGHAGNYRT